MAPSLATLRVEAYYFITRACYSHIALGFWSSEPRQRTLSGCPNWWLGTCFADGLAKHTSWPTLQPPCIVRSPKPPSTLLNHLFRQVVDAAVGSSEFWLQAQHSTGHTHPVAMLQHEAHLLAAHGAPTDVPFTTPLLPLLRSAALATSDGRLFLNIQLSVAHLHDQALVCQASRAASCDTSLWDTDAFFSLVGLLPPQGPGNHSLSPTGTYVRSPTHHSSRLQLRLLLCARGSPMVPRVPRVFRNRGGGVYSPSGLIHRNPPPPRTADATGSRDAVKIVLEEMNPARPLADLLMVPDTLEWPTRPHPALNPHVLHPRAVLPLSVAFLVRWTACHLQSWRMNAGGRLPMRLPPPPTSCWPPG